MHEVAAITFLLVLFLLLLQLTMNVVFMDKCNKETKSDLTRDPESKVSKRKPLSSSHSGLFFLWIIDFLRSWLQLLGRIESANKDIFYNKIFLLDMSLNFFPFANIWESIMPLLLIVHVNICNQYHGKHNFYGQKHQSKKCRKAMLQYWILLKGHLVLNLLRVHLNYSLWMHGLHQIQPAKNPHLLLLFQWRFNILPFPKSTWYWVCTLITDDGKCPIFFFEHYPSFTTTAKNEFQNSPYYKHFSAFTFEFSVCVYDLFDHVQCLHLQTLGFMRESEFTLYLGEYFTPDTFISKEYSDKTVLLSKQLPLYSFP